MYKLPKACALLAYDKVSEACSSVEKFINTALPYLTDQVNKLPSEEVSSEACATTNSNPVDQGLYRYLLTMHHILSYQGFFISPIGKLNLISHGIPDSTNPGSDAKKQDDIYMAVHAAIFYQHLSSYPYYYKYNKAWKERNQTKNSLCHCI